jgi:disulfide bond formation protein DsbB
MAITLSPKQYAVPMMLCAAVPLLAAYFVARTTFPTTLCIYDQYVWYAILGLWAILLFIGVGNVGRIGVALSILLAVIGIGLASLQIGVEQQWIKNPIPNSCNLAVVAEPNVVQGSSSGDIGSCDPPTYLMPDVPISMALMDLVYLCIYLLIIFTTVPI